MWLLLVLLDRYNFFFFFAQLQGTLKIFVSFHLNFHSTIHASVLHFNTVARCNHFHEINFFVKIKKNKNTQLVLIFMPTRGIDYTHTQDDDDDDDDVINISSRYKLKINEMYFRQKKSIA